MKTFQRILTSLLAMTLVAGPYAMAAPTHMNVDIPFAFYVSNKLLPAGSYTINMAGVGAAVEISDRKGNTAFAITSNQRNPLALDSGARIVFKRYGETAFLSEIYSSGVGEGILLATSQTEHRTVRGDEVPARIAILERQG